MTQAFPQEPASPQAQAFLQVEDLEVSFPTEDGVVKAVLVASGASVAADEVLIEFG